MSSSALALRSVDAPTATWSAQFDERRVAFALSAALYLSAGAFLVFEASSLVPDAWSRVGNAYYVLFSRDPHLAAVGFVWGPLPSLVIMLLLPFKFLWPALVAQGFAANIVSALFMGGSVAVVLGLLADVGLGVALRRILALLFALNPMIVLYGANGMSEAPFMFFVLVATRSLLRWERRNLSIDLVTAGVALALAAITRYEAIPVAVTAILGVTLLTAIRSQGSRHDRLLAGVADGLLVGFPVAAAFVGWSFASWIIVGSPLATFTSVYGNTSQIDLAGDFIRQSTGAGTPAALVFFARELVGLAPGLLPLAGLASVLMLVRRDVRPLVPSALFGAAIAFSAWALVTGSSFGWLRFAIMGIPLAALLGGIALAPRLQSTSASEAPPGPVEPRDAAQFVHRRGRLASFVYRSAGRLLIVVVIGATAVAVPVAYTAMSDPALGREEAPQLEALLAPQRGRALDAGRQAAIGGEAAAYLDALQLPRGSVLVDVAIGFPIVLQSRDPAQFVITPDRDFPQALANLSGFGIQYILVPNGSGYRSSNAVGRIYPQMYDTGAGIASLVRQFGATDDMWAWRLYALSPGS